MIKIEYSLVSLVVQDTVVSSVKINSLKRLVSLFSFTYYSICNNDCCISCTDSMTNPSGVVLHQICNYVSEICQCNITVACVFVCVCVCAKYS